MNASSIQKVIVVAALLWVAGCSWATVRGVPSNASLRSTEALRQCTSSEIAPFTDSMLAVAGIGASGAAIQAVVDADSSRNVGRASLMLLPALGATAIATSSAAYGYRHTRRCYALERRAERLKKVAQSYWKPMPGGRRERRSSLDLWKSKEAAGDWKQLPSLAGIAESDTAPERWQGTPYTAHWKPIPSLGGASTPNSQLDLWTSRWIGAMQARRTRRRSESVAGNIARRPSPRSSDLSNKVVFSVEEAAELVGLKPATIRGWIEDGKLRALKAEGSYRISRTELQKSWRRMGGGDLFPDPK